MSNKTFYLNSTFEEKSVSKKGKGLKIAGYANTTSKDRQGDVVTAQAWAKGVDNFRNNPVMLYQHKHDAPIGRFDKITVDKKGIYVEGTVSDAAEKNLGVQTLIRDGALKSFSVGFRVKDAKYDQLEDITTITDVELLEISVVSVPCNQDSLFSVRKNFGTEDEYKAFVENMTKATETTETTTKELEVDINISDDTDVEQTIKAAVNSVFTGPTTNAIAFNGDITKAEEAFHAEVIKTPQLNMDSLSDQVYDMVEDILEQKAAEEAEIKETTEETETKELADVDEVKEVTDIEEEKEDEQDFVDTKQPIEFINLLSMESDTVKVDDNVEYEGKHYKVVEVPSDQNPLFKFLEFDLAGKSCNNTINVSLDELSQNKKIKEIDSEDKGSTKNLDENLHEDSTKENDPMAEQVVETIDLTEKSAVIEAKKEAAPVATVSEPRVAKLIEKTGEAIIKEADAKDFKGEYTPVESEEVAELRSQVAKHKAEIKSLNDSKMAFSENSRNTQFTEKEMADAVFLSQALNKRDVFDTKYGTRMKAITTVDQFLSNFSKNVYAEMEQQLVIAPMFTRLPVDAKKFEVPVADEDTDGDVAMFKSGTYNTGVADTTNVPTTNQHTMSSVEFTPHKFMATTHLAKDEEEDTVLPLLDFLRNATTRRLARAVDKSILRGTGALTGFTASPTNAITAGTGYASVIEGITNLAADASLEVATGSATDKADPSDIAAARTAMGKYGLQLGNDLVFLTSIEGYNNLVTTSDFRTVDKFGPNATYLTGSVGAVYGIPIAISEFLDVAGTAGNHLGVLLYKPGFMIAERRGIEIESEYEPRQQVTAMYLSTRFDFKALTTNSSAALDANKYSYAVNVKAGA